MNITSVVQKILSVKTFAVFFSSMCEFKKTLTIIVQLHKELSDVKCSFSVH